MLWTANARASTNAGLAAREPRDPYSPNSRLAVKLGREARERPRIRANHVRLERRPDARAATKAGIALLRQPR